MKKIFTEDVNKIGVHWFMPHVGEWVEGVPSVGVGEEKYGEGSLYIGEMEYNGKEFYKQGHGVQTFEKSTFYNAGLGGKFGTHLIAFIGEFDRRKADWMYGNGIAYYVDKNGKPDSFIKGYFQGMYVTAPWKGEFDNESLLTGFTPEMETEQDMFGARFTEQKVKWNELNHPHFEYVFLGDSWMDLWNNHEGSFEGDSFKEDANGLSAVNLGIGGTRYFDWSNERLEETALKFNPEKIIVHLGVNDINNTGDVKETCNQMRRFTTFIHQKLPNAQIYLCSTAHVLSHVYNWNKFDEVNAYSRELAKETGYVHYLATGELFLKEDGNVFSDFDTYLIPDKLHLNRKGYDVWAKYIIEEIQK